MSEWVDFKYIREQIGIVDILRHYGLFEDEHAGKEQFKIHCPFHEDSRPSCNIHTGMQAFHCFGSCKSHGGVLMFVRLKEGIDSGDNLADDREAGRLIQEWFNITPERKQTKRKGRRAKLESDQSVNQVSQEERIESEEDGGGEIVSDDRPINPPLGFELQSISLEEGITYAESRGINEDAARTFGLAVAKKGGFKDRLVIPIHDRQDILVGYAARALNDETEPKYLMPSRDKGFYKSHLLFNYSRVRSEAKRVILVEGFFDVIRLHQEGFYNVVACMGTSVSERQIALLKKRFLAVQIFFDGDQAGEQGSRAAAAELVNHLWVKRVCCPGGKQPDQLSREELCELLGEKSS